MLETLGLILIITLLTIIGIYYLPPVLLVFPAGFIAFGIRRGLIQSFTSMLTTILIVGFISDFSSSIILFAIFVPATMVMTYTIKKRKRVIEILGFSTIVLFISIILMIGFLNNIGLDFIGQLENGFKELLVMQLDMLEEVGIEADKIIESKELLENSYKYLIIIMPSIILLISLVISYLNYSISRIILNNMGVGIVRPLRFSMFRLPNNITLGIIVMLLGVYIMSALKLPYHQEIFINLIFLIGFMFFVQGVSVVDFFLKRKKIILLVRLILLAIVLFISPLISILFVIGFIDVIIDLRKIKKVKS